MREKKTKKNQTFYSEEDTSMQREREKRERLLDVVVWVKEKDEERVVRFRDKE